MSSTKGETEQTGAGATDPRRSDLEPGAVINGLYRLVRLLGVGGMGEVWEARHERTKGRVALKLLLSEMGHHEEVLLRFQREVEVTSGLNHPNIVRVNDADKLPNGRPFLVMELLEGRDLSYVSRMGQPLTLAETVEIIEQSAMGLQAAHGQSVIHRDLKPANLFLVSLPGTSRVLVKILDFGISKALDGLSHLTQSRNVMGTPHYMAPEQATGGASSVDARADQFSLAAIAYELLTGRMAFSGDGLANVILKVVHEMPPSFASLGIVTTPGVEAVVMRGLAKSADGRFGSVLELSDELKRAAKLGGGAERLQPAAPLPPLARTLPLPLLGAPGLTQPLPTTLRASAGQMATVEDRNRGARASHRGKAVVLVGVGSALALAGLVGVSWRARFARPEASVAEPDTRPQPPRQPTAPAVARDVPTPSTSPAPETASPAAGLPTPPAGSAPAHRRSPVTPPGVTEEPRSQKALVSAHATRTLKAKPIHRSSAGGHAPTPSSARQSEREGAVPPVPVNDDL